MLPVVLVLVAVLAGGCARGQLVYAVRRPPVRRAASAIEALERMRLAPPPIASYFPQVESEAAGYPVEGDFYALPPQWTEEFGQPVQEEPEYGIYEYEPYSLPIAYRPPQPAYAEEVIPQAYPQDPESAEYSDLMENYLMGSGPPQQTFENVVQRRSEHEPPRPSAAPVIHSNSTQLPSAAPTTQVQMTAVPASPEKKSVQSAVLPDPELAPVSAPGFGQKEEPLFRPSQSSQRTTWSEGLARAKNAPAAPRRTPIPLLKQMIQKGRQQEEDPLMRELSSLKKSL